MATVQGTEPAVRRITPALPMLEIGMSSIPGTRKSQQDACSYEINPEQHECLAVLCDGMGGLNGGERASQTAVSVLTEQYLQTAPVTEPVMFFQQAAFAANQAVASLTDEGGKPLNAGSTLIAVLLRENQVSWLSIGDSRIYLIRDCEAYPCCREHNYETLLNDRLRAGEITPEEAAEDSTRRDALTSYLGMRELKQIEINTQPLSLLPNDMLLLCSDGLYKTLDQETICRMAVEHKMDVQKAAELLTSEALAQATKAQDNTTVILMRWQGDLFGDHFYGQ